MKQRAIKSPVGLFSLAIAGCGAGTQTQQQDLYTTLSQPNIAVQEDAFVTGNVTYMADDYAGTTLCTDAKTFWYFVFDSSNQTVDRYLLLADPGTTCGWLADMTNKIVCHGHGTETWTAIPGYDAKKRMHSHSVYDSIDGALEPGPGDVVGSGYPDFSYNDNCLMASQVGVPQNSVVELEDSTLTSGSMLYYWGTSSADDTSPTPGNQLVTHVSTDAWPMEMCDHVGEVGFASHETGKVYCPIAYTAQ